MLMLDDMQTQQDNQGLGLPGSPFLSVKFAL